VTVSPVADAAGGDSPDGGDFALGDLEFHRVLDLLAARAVTPMGRKLAVALTPSGCRDEVAGRLDLLREGLLLSAEEVRLSFPP
jgi:dsDNA-specific endonuclease/ATPase MutS2